MAELEPNLRTFLKSKSGATSIFGASPNTRIYIYRIDPSITVAYPFAIIRTVTEWTDYAHDGALANDGIYQIDVFSDSLTTAQSGATALMAELTGYSGAISNITAGSCFITNIRGMADPDTKVFKRSFDVQIGQNG